MVHHLLHPPNLLHLKTRTLHTIPSLDIINLLQLLRVMEEVEAAEVGEEISQTEVAVTFTRLPLSTHKLADTVLLVVMVLLLL